MLEGFLLAVSTAAQGVIFTNREACEHVAWQIENTLKGSANYYEHRCFPVDLLSYDAERNIINVTVKRGGVTFTPHKTIEECSAQTHNEMLWAWKYERHASSWCAWTDRPVVVDVGE